MLKRRQHIITHYKTVTPFLYSIPILLTIIGLFFIFEASSVTAYRLLGDSFYYLRYQLLWFFIAVFVMVFFSKFNYKNLPIFAFPLLLFTIISLLVVLIPGIGIKIGGARRWINLGFFSFQPSEVAKFAVIIYLSSWFVHKEKQRFFPFVILLFFIIALTLIQPDMGTAIVLFGLFVLTYYIAEEPIKYLFFLIPFSLLGFLILAQTSSYRMKRLLAFFDPKIDVQGVSYHINQIMISLAAGGIFGRGFMASRQKYQFLPEAHTDSIFAIIGEEVGFLGGLVLIILYLIFLYQIYLLAQRAKDRLAFLLVGSIMIVFSLQIFINLGAMAALNPLTGIPLPFLSYGGSSLLIFYSLIGILLNISKRYPD